MHLLRYRCLPEACPDRVSAQFSVPTSTNISLLLTACLKACELYQGVSSLRVRAVFPLLLTHCRFVISSAPSKLLNLLSYLLLYLCVSGHYLLNECNYVLLIDKIS